MAFSQLIPLIILILEPHLDASIFVRDSTWDLLHAQLLWFSRNKSLLKEEEISTEKVVRIVVADNYPFVKFSNGTLSGFVAEVWKTLEEHLKFETIIHKSKINNELEEFNRTKSDVVLNPIDLNAMDLDHYDHTMPIAAIWYNLIAKIGADNSNSNFYMIIWSGRVRVLYYVTILLLAVFFNRDFTTTCSSRNRKGMSSSEGSFTCSLMHVFATIHNQGDQVIVTKASLKVILLSAAFFGYFMSVSYSALLTSKLATKGVIHPEITFETVIKTKTTLCVSETSYAYRKFINASTNQILDTWSSSLNRSPCSLRSKEKPEASLLPPEDFCHDEAIALEINNVLDNYFFHNKPACKTFKSINRYFYTYLAMMTRKGFPLRKQINQSLLRYHMYGIIEKIKQKWLPKQSREQESAPHITFRHIQTVLSLYCIAVTVSFGVFLLEFLLHRRTKKVKKET